MKHIKANEMDHPTLLMKIIEWCKSIDGIAGLSLGSAFGFIHFLDTYLLSDPSFFVAATKSLFVAILTGLGACLGTASGKWFIKFIKDSWTKNRKR